MASSAQDAQGATATSTNGPVKHEMKAIPVRREFKQVESERPPFDQSLKFHQTQTKSPNWTPGSGSNSRMWQDHKHIEINPYGPGRKPTDNYKLLISGVIPRPVGFISTIHPETSTPNLAPFSYTMVVNHDPPIFCVGFSGGRGSPKDTCHNLLSTGECVINIISDWFIEAANYCAVNSPPQISEWGISGLTPAKSSIVKPARVAESAFSIEGRLVAHHEWETPAVPGKKTGVTCLIEGVNFWVREDAINEEGNVIDPGVLRPISRLGGITYGRVIEAFELPRPDWEKEAKAEWERIQKEKVQINGEAEKEGEGEQA